MPDTGRVRPFLAQELQGQVDAFDLAEPALGFGAGPPVEQVGLGWIGRGWSLTGLSMIRRESTGRHANRRPSAKPGPNTSVPVGPTNSVIARVSRAVGSRA